MNPKTLLSHVPGEILEVALISAETSAALAEISTSTWYELVRNKKAPQPALRRHRCTRWRLADVRNWLVDFAAQGSSSEASQVVANAAKASAAAKAVRKSGGA